MKAFVPEGLDDMLARLPEEPGVYIFRDAEGTPLYVGKSCNIKKRVLSHFHLTKGSVPVASVHDVEFMLTDGDLEALTLECNLIKRMRPLFNARLKDDKSYPYIKITTGEPFPGIYITRNVRQDGSLYFGPYADVGSARRSVRIIRQIFPIRNCRRRMDRPSRPCLDYHIRRCAGPCTGKADPEEYSRNVEGARRILEGKADAVLEQMRRQMREAALAQNYEKAAILRDRIRSLERTALGQRLSSPGAADVDVLGVSLKGDLACVQVLFVRDGRIVDQEYFLLDAPSSTEADVLSGFIKEFYSYNILPREIVLPSLPEEIGEINRWLSTRSSLTMGARLPRDRGEERLVLIAKKNAEMMLRLEDRETGDLLKTGLQEIAAALGLTLLPRVIEAFDVSNMSGKEAVASMVRFRWGRPNRSLYRRFRIRGEQTRDDYAMMAEAVTRRFSRALRTGESLPDLVLVDGGPGQAAAAREAITRLGLSLPVVGLAKRLEELYPPGSYSPIRIEKDSPGHRLLRRIRDEAHRFAVSYHRKLWTRRLIRSELEEVRGIGPKRSRALIERFGSVEGVMRASLEEVASTPGMNRALARRVLDHLRGLERGRVD